MTANIFSLDTHLRLGGSDGLGGNGEREGGIVEELLKFHSTGGTLLASRSLESIVIGDLIYMLHHTFLPPTSLITTTSTSK